MLDDEVDNQDHEAQQSSAPSRQMLPAVLSFLQSAIPTDVYLEILVQCTRKTELRSWRTLFAYLPPPRELFEQALRLNSLKTAGGYLLVLQAFDEKEDGDAEGIEDSVVRLLKLASQRGDWELCGELARFLIALDGSGQTLQRAVVKVGLRKENQSSSDALDVSHVDRGPTPSTRTLGLAINLPDEDSTTKEEGKRCSFAT